MKLTHKGYIQRGVTSTTNERPKESESEITYKAYYKLYETLKSTSPNDNDTYFYL